MSDFRRCSLNDRGFTFVEVLIAAAVSVMILAALSAVLSGSLSTWRVTSSSSAMQHSANVALFNVTSRVRRANTAEILEGPPSGLKATVMTESGSYTYIFARDGSNLTVQTALPSGSVEFAVVASDVTDFSVSEAGTDSYSIGITCSDGTRSYTARTVVTLRR
ncbi:MAG: prepilin-type N-terminal cleavage/methylation domain-containing protein [Firmicutes bacterium]|nr:prepilin-type N-terminal cleavage/methylation domain-containing protein [Bacillota bacterium]